MFSVFCRSIAVLAFLSGALAGTAYAQTTLTIGVANEPLSVDPQFSRASPNQQLAAHIFNRLNGPDTTGKTRPDLAEKWENIDPLTWVVHLRKNVTFHDGSPFTAADVVYSFERAPRVPNSPASYAASLANIASMKIEDDHTIRFKTKTPSPLFMEDIGYVYIISKKASEGKTTVDFNSGSAAIGTGPYKLVKWTHGDNAELVRNDKYWGPKPAYEKVVIRYIPNNAARIVALRTGAVDVIDQVPAVDVGALKADPALSVYSTASFRIVYMEFNLHPDAPLLTDLQGQRLPKNPLLDKRVRQAMSLMVDRQAIVDRLLQGTAEPASQFVNKQSFGYNSALPVVQPDLAKAKTLLADAGYPNGFGISMHTSNDRFPQDKDMAQALAQMFTRGGLKINNVQALPFAVYSKDATTNQYAAYFFSYGNTTAESLTGLLTSFHTPTAGGAIGTLNRGKYSNKAFDAKLDAAAEEFNEDKRESLLKDAASIAYEDAAFIPLYFQQLNWAAKKGIDYEAAPDEKTLAMRARPK